MHRERGKHGTGLCLRHPCGEGLTREKNTESPNLAVPAASQKAELGQRGEEIAADHLAQQGLQILERRWKDRAYEIDIIAFDPATEEMVFVEVKTRSSSKWGHPESAIDNRKVRRSVKAAHYYLCSRHITYPARFDIYSIILSPQGTEEIEHIKNAFYPPLG